MDEKCFFYFATVFPTGKDSRQARVMVSVENKILWKSVKCKVSSRKKKEASNYFT